ncbi:YfbU family protein (plasmid) [Microvirga sp. RSM25]|uniref:YfbU family protein n=1 Tax=Microvirga sp. RSM25 TaxID=3273802 RepID=UPI00384DDA20
MPPKIPRVAEYQFAQMCAEFGATSNKSQEDETGWDYIVEFPPTEAVGLPADMRPASRSCLVQIKSTTTGQFSCRLKLSNALRFAKASLPCFVVLFRFDKAGKEPPRVYAAHFWEELIARTFKTARQLEAEGKADFHRHYITVPFERDSSVDSKLMSQMLREIESLGDRYLEQKRGIANRVGFDDGFGYGSVAFAEGVSLEQVIDAQLGLVESLQFSRLVLKSVRFGVETPTPLLELIEGGTFETEASSTRPCTVVLASSKGGAEVAIGGEIVSPGIPDLPEEYQKLRVRTPLFDLVFKPFTSETSFRMHVDYSKALPLPTLIKFFKLRHMACTGSIDCQMWMVLERSYNKLSEEEKKRIKVEAEPFGGDVRFGGFDANNERHFGVAQYLIQHLNRFDDFKDRYLNSHSQVVDVYKRMNHVFEPIVQGLHGKNLDADQIIQVLKASRYPE